MATIDRPRLRPLSAWRVEHQGRLLVRLDDPVGAMIQPVFLNLDWFEHVARHFNGQSSLLDIQARVLRSTGMFLSLASLQESVAYLESAMVLEGPTFQAFLETFRESGRRPAAFAGRSYAAAPRALEAQLEQYFVTEDGAGRPDRAVAHNQPLRGIFSPHIDFRRGGKVYSHAYRQLVEQSQADVFVILGVSHRACRRRFVLTRKDFETPLGLARTDRGYVDRLIQRAGVSFLDDELAHRSEHSIEFQVVFLQHVLGERTDYSIVPILAGSFHDLIAQGRDPLEDLEVAAFVSALDEVERSSGKRIVYIGGIDLCHVGPEFGDHEPVSDQLAQHVRRFDQALLERASAGDALGWFQTAAAIQNRFRVCGLAAGYTMLKTIGKGAGRLLRYDQAIDPARTSCVTFASMMFHAQGPPAAGRDGPDQPGPRLLIQTS